MRIGYYVQGSADQAFVFGLIQRWCPAAKCEAGRFRGASGVSLRREIPKVCLELAEKGCDFIIMLTDSDKQRWQSVLRRESLRIPVDYEHMTVFGVAHRNIGWWIALDKGELANELGVSATDIPHPDPSGFIDRRFGLLVRGAQRKHNQDRLSRFVANVPMGRWLKQASFKAFYDATRAMSQRNNCTIPMEIGDSE